MFSTRAAEKNLWKLIKRPGTFCGEKQAYLNLNIVFFLGWLLQFVEKKTLNKRCSEAEYTLVAGNSIQENMVIGFYRRPFRNNSVKLFLTYFSMICIDTTLESLVKLYSMKTKSLGWGGDGLTLTPNWTWPVYLLTLQNLEAFQSLITQTQAVHPTFATKTWVSYNMFNSNSSYTYKQELCHSMTPEFVLMFQTEILAVRISNAVVPVWHLWWGTWFGSWADGM